MKNDLGESHPIIRHVQADISQNVTSAYARIYIYLYSGGGGTDTHTMDLSIHPINFYTFFEVSYK